MFADGTTIYYVGKEVKEIIDALNHVLNDFQSSDCSHWKDCGYADFQPYFCWSIKTSHKLNWKSQVKALHTKFGGRLKLLKKFKTLLSSVLEEIYFKGIVPSITYCIAIWGSCSPPTFYTLEHLHLKAAKLVYKLPTETPDTDVLDLVKWKPLVYVYKRRLASVMYQIYHNSLSDQFTALLETCNTNTN